MPARFSFSYAVARVVPRVEREEFVNAGVLLYCEARDYLAARIELDEARLRAIAPDADVATARRHLAAIAEICHGGEGKGPIGLLPTRERWRWLVAPRSTMVQVSPAHAGLTTSPEDELERLVRSRVRPSRAP